MRASFAMIGMITLLAAGAPALAMPGDLGVQPDAEMKVAGTLTCQVSPGLGLGVASSRPGTCIFDHIGAQGFSETYDSRLARVGFDVGVMGSESFKLTVLTPNGDATPGMLVGSHRGQSSEVGLVKTEGLKVSFHNDRAPIEFRQSGESSWVGLNLGSGETSLTLDNPHGI